MRMRTTTQGKLKERKIYGQTCYKRKFYYVFIRTYLSEIFFYYLFHLIPFYFTYLLEFTRLTSVQLYFVCLKQFKKKPHFAKQFYNFSVLFPFFHFLHLYPYQVNHTSKSLKRIIFYPLHVFLRLSEHLFFVDTQI